MLDIEGLHIRAALFRFVRTFFQGQGFLEVDTPIRQPVIIPESAILAIGAEGQFLQTSPELCMKRLLAAGCRNIFQICPCFRKEERGRRHLEEFTMLEWYRCGVSYEQLMADCDALFCHLATAFADPVATAELGLARPLDLDDRWLAGSERLTVAEAFARYSPIPLAQALATDRFDEILVEFLEPNFGNSRPLILYDYPATLASLARLKDTDPQIAERFELYSQGLELANGFSELTNPKEQRLRFLSEIAVINKADGCRAAMPERVLTDLAHMPTAAGIALGLDRLLMLLLNKTDIAKVVSFAPADL